jgi:hypothetical protein
VRGTGTCTTVLGYVWGGGCEPVVGCGCEGADCGSLVPTPLECFEAHRSCTIGSCGGFAGVACDDTAYCEIPFPFPDSPGVCVPRPTSCEGASPLVACTGSAESPSVCEAHRTGHGVVAIGSCSPSIFPFGSVAPGCGDTGSVLTLSTADEACTGPFGTALYVRLRTDVETLAPATLAITMPGGVGDGTAGLCFAGACRDLAGTVRITAVDAAGMDLEYELSEAGGGPPITRARHDALRRAAQRLSLTVRPPTASRFHRADVRQGVQRSVQLAVAPSSAASQDRHDSRSSVPPSMSPGGSKDVQRNGGRPSSAPK